MNVVDIFLVILIICASALCVFTILYLKKLLQEVEAVRRDVHQLVEKATPVLENLEDVTRRANRVVSEVENYWDQIDNSIKNLREKVTNLTSFTKIRDAVSPATELIRNVKAFAKGIAAFWQEYKQR